MARWNMEKIIIEKIEVDVKLTEDPEAREKAVVNITLGPFKVKGFRIQPSKYPNRRGEYIWIAPPSYRSRKGQWHREFHCEDKDLWEEIEDKIYEEYNRKKEMKDNEIPIVEDRSL